MPDFTFPKRLHLLSSADFDRVFAAKCSRSDENLIVYTAVNTVGFPRLGLVVSKKVGNAVIRNRWKRYLREAFRLSQHELPPGVDLVVLPKTRAQRDTTTPDTAKLQASLVALVRQAARKLNRS